MARVVGTYLDESGTDNGGEVAVVAGLILNWNSFANLDMEWEKELCRYGVPAIHMKEFGIDGKYKDFPESDRRKLFTALTRVINEEKEWSIAATLSTEGYRKYFSWLGKRGWSQYATCFLLGAVLQGKQLDYEKYPYDVPFMLDNGNPYKHEVEQAHGFLVNDFRDAFPCHCGPLDFGDDQKIRALQAADVIAWAVRRRNSGKPFKDGFEPLVGIFEQDHVEQGFEGAWMIEISEALRAKFGS